MSRRNPVSIISTAAFCIACLSAPAFSQQRQSDSVKVREVSAVQARSQNSMGTILSLRAIADGHVLVNDAFNRQLLELDDKLAIARIVLDSVGGTKNYYGPVAAPLIQYLGDSSYFVDGSSLTLLLLDGKANIVRSVAAPTRNDFRILAGTPSFSDRNGNLVYRTTAIDPKSTQTPKPEPDGSTKLHQGLLDSASIVRANFDTRMVDTIAHTKQQNGSYGEAVRYADGKILPRVYVHPLDPIDEWAILSDGSIALLRGHDYHVDIISPDGQQIAGRQLPYDWKKLGDDDKRTLVDSVQRVLDALMEAAIQSGQMQSVMSVINRTAGRYSTSMSVLLGPTPRATPTPSGNSPKLPPVQNPPKLFVVPVTDIPDFEPPFSPGALHADYEGNLWVLPARSRNSLEGELVYDIVNNHGQLVERVRMPAGRSVAGFGPNGTVYLMSSVGENAWSLESVRVKR